MSETSKDHDEVMGLVEQLREEARDIRANLPMVETPLFAMKLSEVSVMLSEAATALSTLLEKGKGSSSAAQHTSPDGLTASPCSAGWLERAVANDEWVLASSTGAVWFQCLWDDQDECWVTFNRYLENDFRTMVDRKWSPTMFAPLPLPLSTGSPPISPSEASAATSVVDEPNPHPTPPIPHADHGT
jgi:hypothetical protein